MSKTIFIHYCRTEMVVSGSTFCQRGSLLGSRYLCGMVRDKLVYNNDPRKAEASTSPAILFGCIQPINQSIKIL